MNTFGTHPSGCTASVRWGSLPVPPDPLHRPLRGQALRAGSGRRGLPTARRIRPGRTARRTGQDREDRRLPPAGAVRARRRRDLHRRPDRRASPARPRGRCRHAPLQVVPGRARAEPGLPLAACRPRRKRTAAPSTWWSRRSFRRTACATRTRSSGCSTSSARRTSSTARSSASSPSRRPTEPSDARCNASIACASVRRAASSRPRRTSPTGSRARRTSPPR